MKVLKFGGSSLADSECFQRVAQIVNAEGELSAVATVVSAPKGMTNSLVTLSEKLSSDELSNSISKVEIDTLVSDIESRLAEILKSSISNNKSLPVDMLEQQFSQLIKRLKQLCEGAVLLGHCPKSTFAQILSTGEKFSVLLLSSILASKGHKITTIDPEKFLTIEATSVEPIADCHLSIERFNQFYSETTDMCFMPGFIGRTQDGETTTLGRNGSDYSAAILSVCIGAELCEVWTDVDGVYNSDPNLIADAKLIEKMSYSEAMELSYFGAKILHPKTILPLLKYNIPCKIKNTHAPEKQGTLISSQAGSDDLIKSVTNLSDVAMVTISGPEMRGMVGMASRVFSAISQSSISIILISQSSAELTISFCVPGHEADAAERCLNKAFQLEIKNDLIDPITIRKNLAIITLVGDKMQQQRGIAAKFFSSLAQARVNIISIAQDSSERSISAVVRAKRIEDAVKICHQNLFVNRPSIDALIIGCGTIGTELIQQIQSQQQSLLDKNIALNVVAIANSHHVALNKDGIDLTNWQELLQHSNDPFKLEKLADFVADSQLNNPVIVDCTSSEIIAMNYNNFLKNGFHLVTANKKANTSSFEYYTQLRETAAQQQRKFLYETNVGAGLPVIDNLQGLLRAGDQLNHFSGILSGSLSFIFSEIHNGLTLSEATLKAKSMGFTEPNPAEDLSGLDVARKALVIAREAGLKSELSDIQVTGVIPETLASISDTDEFMKQLPEFDEVFSKQVQQAEDKNQVLRYLASIDGDKIKVGIEAVDQNHPMYSVTNGENALAMHTKYYHPIPFVIRGYGAGAPVTAAGLFGDLLKTVSLNQSY